MSSRGRGFSGGRGRSGPYRSSFRGNRGGYDSGRGRGGGYSSYSSNDRYNSGDRYGRDRGDDGFKKSYRSESSHYSGRDYGRSGSPERKRMRMEGMSGDRRSHDGGHYGSSYGRQDSYVSERRSFAEERRRSPGRDGYRKSGGMAPPRSPPRAMTRARSRPPRRTLRGRTMRSRSSFRGMRSRGGYASRPHASYTRVFRALKGRSSIKSKPESASSTEEDWDAEDKEDDQEEKKSDVKTKSPKVEEEDDAEEEEEVAADGDETDKEGAADASDAEQSERPAPASARPYVSLLCVHCKEKPHTFVAYVKHLVGARHRAAMGGVARRHKSQLIRMRLAQRRAQRDLESAAGAELTPRTTFCPVCRLNHRTTRHAHNLSDTHRAMKRFLNPYCRVCHLTFRSPMVYEHHIVQLDHIKRKASIAPRPSPKAEEASGDEGMDVDLENFMTLDSVGDVDEVDDEDSDTEKKEEVEKPKTPKKEINIGSEHIKKVEVWWCGLCRVYLHRAEPGSAEETEVRRRHCRLRAHLGRYVQHRDTRTLRRHAERIHRQLHREAEKDNASAEENPAKEEKAESAEEKNKSLENGTSTASVGDDKLWADVDKDIGDLLREVAPQGNVGSDDEEDLDRYDKFRKSDKKLKGEEDSEENAGVTKDNANSEIEAAA